MHYTKYTEAPKDFHFMVGNNKTIPKTENINLQGDFSHFVVLTFKVTAMQTEQTLINVRLCVSKVV